MSPPPNEAYTAFSFIGFVLCAIPLYWHLEGNVDIHTGWSTYFKLVWLSSECRHLLIHDLD